jgi:tetratricopeptide (TPR) repeat protein
MTRLVHTSLLTLALTCALGAMAAPGSDATLKKARARMKSLDFEVALPLLERLRDTPGSQPFRTSLYLDLGVTYVNLGRFEDARKAFDEALELTPTLELPTSSAPKVRRVFEEARDARAARLAPPPVEPAPTPPPPPAPAREPMPDVVKPAARPRLIVPPIALAGGGLGAVLFGLISATQSQQATRVLSGALHSTSEVEQLLARRQTWGTLTWVGYGVGAACLLAGAALFLFSGETFAPVALVTPDSAAFAVSGHF